MSRLQPRNRDAAQARIDRMVRMPVGETVPLPSIATRGQVKPVAVAVPDRDDGQSGQGEFRGLMALLAGIERALVDLNVGLSMHSADAKNFNMGKAKTALTDGLADFKRAGGAV